MLKYIFLASTSYFFPLFESSPCCLCTHRICNRFCIVMLDSYHVHHPACLFCVIALILYHPFWICLAHFKSLHSSCIADFGSSPSHPFRVITYRQFWLVTLLWQIRWATQKLLSDTLVMCFLLSEMGTLRRQSRHTRCGGARKGGRHALFAMPWDTCCR